MTSSLIAADGPHFGTGLKLIETTHSGSVLWLRTTTVPAPLAAGGSGLEGDCPPAAGRVRMRLNGGAWGPWLATDAAQDGVVQLPIRGLAPGSEHRIEAEAAPAQGDPTARIDGRFKTLPDPDGRVPATVAVVTCQRWETRDDPSGPQTYASITALKPDGFIHTGDVVYYDKGLKTVDATTSRVHWARMYALPRVVELHRGVPAWFLKDDHDLLNNDCVPGSWKPNGTVDWDQGIALFREQTGQPETPYRTVRFGAGLECWLLETRSLRAPRKAGTSAANYLGQAQWTWLQHGLKTSTARWRVVVSPVPVVGPDKANKADNLANADFAGAADEIRGLIAGVPGTVVVTGDRHWQYHTVDPKTGVQEFCPGTVCQKDTFGSPPTDPAMHRFHEPKQAGFLSLQVTWRDGKAALAVCHHGTDGTVRNTADLGLR